MARAARPRPHARTEGGELALEDATTATVADRDDHPAKSLPASTTKTLGQALTQILVADLSMSLDNVLAVAGAAREHPAILVFGLLLSITLTGLAASWIARLLQKWRWLGYVGLAIIFYVALHMISRPPPGGDRSPSDRPIQRHRSRMRWTSPTRRRRMGEP